MSRYRLVLPVVPEPPQGAAAVMKPAEGFKGPIFKGSGDTDLLCGNCYAVIADALGAGQLNNMVLQCPECRSYNGVVTIPKLEQFVGKLQQMGLPTNQIPAFKQVLESAIGQRQSVEEITAQVQKSAPDFSWFEEMLVPSNPGELYAFLGFVVALLAWWQSRSNSQKAAPNVVINNFFSDTDPFKGTGVNEPCPCGSGKKFKVCHGKRS